MRRAILICIFSVAAGAAFFPVFAQKDRFAYAVTGTQRQATDWSVIRRFDLQTGTYSNFQFNGKNADATVFDAATKKPFTQPNDPGNGPIVKEPFGGGVAAMAYDKTHHRLYFTPMFLGQLRYLDLHSQKLYYVIGQPLLKANLQQPAEGKVVTRMVIAPDGYGYAITNDGEHMMRFTTGRNPKITHLGALIDAPENGGLSVHARCTGYGGDMVADDAGNLLIVTAQNHVFKVTPANRMARYIGTVKGLPASFTINGAVVDDEGRLLVSSGVDESDYYRVDMETLQASAFKATGVFRSSDLANSNYLKTASTKPAVALANIKMPAAKNTRNIQVFPNPATGGAVTLQFHKIAPGDYTINLTDVLGRSLQARQVTIAFEGQTQALTLPRAKGVYLVRVTDRNRRLAHEEKVVVQ